MSWSGTQSLPNGSDDYLKLAGELTSQPKATWLSVDLSHLGLDVDPQRCAEHLAAIASALPAGRRIQVGAEDYDHIDRVLDCVLAVAGRGLADRLGATVPANFRRSAGTWTGWWTRAYTSGLSREPTSSRQNGRWPTAKRPDIAYLHLAHRLAETDARFALATHDGVLREALLRALGPRPIEQLLGVRPQVLDDLVSRGVPVRVYVPFGNEWFRYWMRRVAECQGA